MKSARSEERAYIEMLQEQISEQARCIEEVRGVKHDMHAHMIVLSHYLTAKEYEKAQDYICKIMNLPVFQNSTFVDVGNDMVNALISRKIHESQSEIAIVTSGLLPERFWIEDMDLCVLFSNLISNSVEACEKLTYKEKVITLIIEENEDDISFLVKNPVEFDLSEENVEWSTTKADKQNHGYGLRNIKNIVGKYCGNMNISCEDGLVLVKVRLPHVVENKAL